ncbi:transcription initiation factor TFIID subunit 12-like [Sycon ciliatum]|uniref:transcription initiation factor TFIID subunit 12-like n=1 Tax=Sycon ciliatum TaxID=27933 RepID=UPI0020A843B1|eukprot:scpid76021/ scgid10771/ Transcription initiation factor TFIID subunit 12; TFIID subunit p22; Transcription initiation factor TFIID 20/15 kDa subunits
MSSADTPSTTSASAATSTSTPSLVTTGLSAVTSSNTGTVGTVCATANRQPIAANGNGRTPGVLISSSSNATSARSLPTLVGIDPLPSTSEPSIMPRKRLHDLVQEINPNQSLDEEVEEFLLSSIDSFVDSAIGQACEFAKHRNSTTLGTRDLQLYLERTYNMYIPGFGTERARPYKKPFTTEAHKQRLNLIRKTTKK